MHRNKYIYYKKQYPSVFSFAITAAKMLPTLLIPHTYAYMKPTITNIIDVIAPGIFSKYISADHIIGGVLGLNFYNKALQPHYDPSVHHYKYISGTLVTSYVWKEYLIPYNNGVSIRTQNLITKNSILPNELSNSFTPNHVEGLILVSQFLFDIGSCPMAGKFILNTLVGFSYYTVGLTIYKAVEDLQKNYVPTMSTVLSKAISFPVTVLAIKTIEVLPSYLKIDLASYGSNIMTALCYFIDLTVIRVCLFVIEAPLVATGEADKSDMQPYEEVINRDSIDFINSEDDVKHQNKDDKQTIECNIILDSEIVGDVQHHSAQSEI